MILKENLVYVNIFGIMNIVAYKGSLKIVRRINSTKKGNKDECYERHLYFCLI